MKEQKLVSIISPCYNGEFFVGRFIESILNQTYDNIEFIIVNDGSTDRTEDVILFYKEAFEKKGYKFIYLKQENAGASAALNKALELFSGEFLSWPDSDDFLPPDAISKLVQFLDNNPSYGLVKGGTETVDNGTFAHRSYLAYEKPQKVGDFFFILLKHFAMGGYLVRSKFFRDVMPVPLIIQAPKEIGQQFQLLLPISYKYPCGFISDICYVYTVRLDSHSHTNHTFEQIIKILDISDKVLKNIAKDIDATDEQRAVIEKAILMRKLTFTLSTMFHHHRRDNIDKIIYELKSIGEFKNRVKYMALCIKYPLLGYMYEIYKKSISRLIHILLQG